MTGLTDTSSGGDVLALQEALQVPHLEMRDGEPQQRARAQQAAGRAHGAAAAPQAAAAVVALALAAHALPLEHAELHRAALARHLASVACQSDLDLPLSFIAYHAPTPVAAFRACMPPYRYNEFTTFCLLLRCIWYFL